MDTSWIRKKTHSTQFGSCKEIKGLFDKADFLVCNFEAPIHTNGTKPIKKSGPALKQSEKAPQFLRDWGFNVILLANNHIMDYGKEGCDATIKAFDDVVTIGAGEAKDAYCVKYIESKGKKIGLCSLVQNEFGVVEGQAGRSFGTAWINSLDVPEIIREAKLKCVFLVVFPHARVEHTAAPLPEWRDVYKQFVDLVADAVIAGHPH